MLRRFHVENYKALRAVTIDLTPIHVLIGPNDSGKTSVLEAIAALSRSATKPMHAVFQGHWEKLELVWQQRAELPVVLEAEFAPVDTASLGYQLRLAFSTHHEPRIFGERIEYASETVWERTAGQHSESWVSSSRNPGLPDSKEIRSARQIVNLLDGTSQYRWVPQHLALPVESSASRSFVIGPTGLGLARFLDDLLGEYRKEFDELERRFCELFQRSSDGQPTFGGIKLRSSKAYRISPEDPVSVVEAGQAGKRLYFSLAGSDAIIPASQASDGVLIILAYLAVLYSPKPPRFLLLEEPENGIHPKRLVEIIGMLRELVAEQGNRTQIVLTTHSPYLLDLFQPEEVTLLRREADGAVSAHPFSRSRRVQEQIDLFHLGEIWTAEGDDALAGETEAGSQTTP
jgi:predicted ATPase